MLCFHCVQLTQLNTLHSSNFGHATRDFCHQVCGVKRPVDAFVQVLWLLDIEKVPHRKRRGDAACRINHLAILRIVFKEPPNDCAVRNDLMLAKVAIVIVRVLGFAAPAHANGVVMGARGRRADDQLFSERPVAHEIGFALTEDDGLLDRLAA